MAAVELSTQLMSTSSAYDVIQVLEASDELVDAYDIWHESSVCEPTRENNAAEKNICDYKLRDDKRCLQARDVQAFSSYWKALE